MLAIGPSLWAHSTAPIDGEVEQIASNHMAHLRDNRAQDARPKRSNNQPKSVMHFLGLGARSASRRSDRLFGQKLLEQPDRVGVHGPGDGDKFHEIDAALAALVFGDKGLRLAELFRQPMLTDAGFLSHCDKKGDQPSIICGFEGLFHGRRTEESAAGNLIPEMDYPKNGLY